ncbi:MAG: PQQ-dependent dehydrogenase, methanol/ethanol family [Betaproteobacteria bacterium]|uniref:PQQ-dependent dehydrogenase, methanol/ethanol family n=1 Tax=Thiomonas sp. FB-6 TaxID=1158291 RepID=UPI0003680DC0|nr:PQQ-dependent dehydrogenase, methanol/ethanol family [Thiomonas sp. FB-6]MBU6440184.1 PQQ-dependent dehydrogenase, methanol/ethanol family [Betaproteobacteria bacterium]MBU6513086.1 PQQ-dependent dehydrogenase, methanol/ethanol family [Betaproteobacteria bacterium]MDE1955472.1 PQQ-dependent dehydrogenase, methanol/ethanol family [Betaproteobacteria bacterium]MDE2152853.1 PQQ-dependent dehydrogenase, methanol/ethanol family [Betaproteobacteria bacterium]MDE2478879.1 PQQ-dependent dehydrogena
MHPSRNLARHARAFALSALGLGLAGSALAAGYPAVTQQRLDAAADSTQWLTYYHSYGGESYSPAQQVDTGNVHQLKMVWSYKFPADLTQGFESVPVVNGDYMFVTTPKDHVYAFQASSGKELWNFDPHLPKIAYKTVCCDVVNRGVALYGDKLFVAMLSGEVAALDAQTGNVDWRKQVFDPGIGYAFTLAPLVANNKLYLGSAGGEYGARGFIEALDVNNGDKVWKSFNVPAPDEKGGDTWPKGMYLHAGSPAWLTGTYDPASNTLYWGVGNPGPWLAELRPGKNLYSDSLLALDGDNGSLKWHFQYTQHDTWDYDGVNTALRAKIHYEGKDYDALLHADRNGFFIAIDRQTGKLIYAKPFVRTESVVGYDKNGESINDPKKYPTVGTEIRTCPQFLGGKNWWSMAYDPRSHIVVIPTLHACGSYNGTKVSYMQGLPYLGEGFGIHPEPGSKGYGEVQAIDVDTGKRVWGHWSKMPWNGGVTATAGGIAFTGSLQGHLYAFDTKTGKVLWKSPKLASGIVAQPSVFEVDGKEYVAILTGYGGANPIWGGPMATMTKDVPRGGTLYVFSL